MKKYFKNKNIILLYIYNFLSTFLLFRSCDTLYYLSKGVTSSNYVFFTVVSAVLILLFQIPIGTLGDKISKKKMLLISNLASFTSIIFFITSKNYFGLVIGILFQTLQTLFANGIINSYLYNEVKEKKEFSKMIVVRSVFSYTGYGIAMILGGIIADISLVMMYYISLIPVSLNFVIILLLDNVKTKENMSVSFNDILKDAKDIIKNKKIIRYLLLYQGLLVAFVSILMETHPEYSNNLGISASMIGLYTAIMLLFGIIGQHAASKIKSDNIKIFIFPIIISIFLIIIGLLNHPSFLLLIILIEFLYDGQYNGMISLMHDNINDKSRVTMEGFLSIITNLFGFAVGLLITLMLKFMEVHIMYIISGIILFIYLVIIFIKYKKFI